MWKLTVISISAPVSLLNCVGRHSPDKLFWVKWGKGRSVARSRHFLKGGNIDIGWKVIQMSVDHGRDLRAATFSTTRRKPRLPVLHHTWILEPGKVDSLQSLTHLTRLTPRGWCYCTYQDSTYYSVTRQAFNFKWRIRWLKLFGDQLGRIDWMMQWQQMYSQQMHIIYLILYHPFASCSLAGHVAWKNVQFLVNAINWSSSPMAATQSLWTNMVEMTCWQ